ncbi:hypothetical protein CUMW_221940 [Citrus unshiu]|uniref:Uncharacterized protein n=1 Tax=Citrus unshiu TaxID=55188 RepID=A0A2H5QEH9_CITUN|nr:hypothetical protein CUMW_221940 [Citrus unshiu]
MMHFFEEFRKNGVLPIQSPKVPSEKGSCSEEPRMKKKCSKKKQVHMQNECFKKTQEYKVPARIDALCKYARRVLTKALFIEIYPGIFNNEQAELYLSVDDIVQFCSMEKIGVATIICYMKHLYEVLKDRPQEHIYKFESSNSESSMSGDSDPLQVDELIDSDTSASSSSDSETDSYLKKINVLTKDQETFLELVKHISDPNLQKEYLDKLLKTLDFNKAETSKIPITKRKQRRRTPISKIFRKKLKILNLR